MRRVNHKEIHTSSEAPQGHARPCQHPGCREEGVYRAPVARHRLNEYYWFCLDHVRAYNLSWDYFKGMSETEIERQRQRDTVWERPSWRFGHFGGPHGDHTEPQFRDPFGFFSEGPASTPPPGPVTEEQKALAVLDLKEPVTFEDIRARYRVLVKKLHPDANGGNPEAEERLKAVNQAYTALKISFA